MKQLDERFNDFDRESRDIIICILLLPQPVSLDVLCAVTAASPVTILQLAEKMVKSRDLLRAQAHGAGYYSLADVTTAGHLLQQLPDAQLFQIAEQAISRILSHFPDHEARWLHVAHVYQISGLPVRHFDELVKAAHSCVKINRSEDAAVYYSMALSGLEQSEHHIPGPDEPETYIDAAIGICTCRNNALSPNIQAGYLRRALSYCSEQTDDERRTRLRVLFARALTKTGNYDQADHELQCAEELVATGNITENLRLFVALARSELLYWQGYINRAITHYENATNNNQSQQELPSNLEILRIYVTLGWIYGLAGETARALQLIDAVQAKARKLNARDVERYSTLGRVFVLSDSGRIDEASATLGKIFNVDEAELDDFILWPGNGKRAYFAYCRGDYEQAFFYQDQAFQHSQALEFPHQRGPDNLEYMLGLEQLGMVHPHWNFDAEVNRLLNWPDIFMRGVALRYRALRAFMENGATTEVENDLREAISLLSHAGARIELGHAWITMARVRLRQRRLAAAEKLLKTGWEIFARINPSLYPKELKAYLDPGSRQTLWVESILQISAALNNIDSIDSPTRSRSAEYICRQLLQHAVKIAGAERGAILLSSNHSPDGELTLFSLVAGHKLDEETIISDDFTRQMRIIRQVNSSAREFIQNYSRTPSTAGNASDHGWTSCFPVRFGVRVLGVIYLECRQEQLELFDEEVEVLRLLSNLAAIGLKRVEVAEQHHDELVDLEMAQNSQQEGTQTGKQQIYRSSPHVPMIGKTHSFIQMLKLIKDVAASDTTVMITGETGVGKELVAQAIHQSSQRAAGPFIAVNVVSLSPELIASELFGHERGAFTGASQTRKGRFELASEGTLFLDDIDAFPLDLQAKMLRVLETKAFERVGSSRTLQTSFRLLASSNRKIEDLVELGLFRSDFYYRLNVFPIAIPPLRERVDDIPALAHHFMAMFSRKFNKKVNRISRNDLRRLTDYHWPGNVRELRHVIERGVLLSSSDRLELSPLNAGVSPNDDDGNKMVSLKEMEARYIIKALARCRGKVSGNGGAAELLDIKPTTLYSMMKRLGVSREGYKFVGDGNP